MSILKKVTIGTVIVTVLLGLLFGSNPPSESEIMQRSVEIVSRRGLCSGVQIKAPSGVDYILTAAHCRKISDDELNYEIVNERGQHIMRKLIAEDTESDLLLLEGLPGVSGLPIASYEYRGEHVRTFTHGRGKNTYKTEGRLIGEEYITLLAKIDLHENMKNSCDMPKYIKIESMFGFDVCLLSLNEMASTAKVVPGSSGGMVVNDSGELVEIVSAGDPEFSYFVLNGHINKFLAGY